VTEPQEHTRRSPRLLVLSRGDDRQPGRVIETAISRGADWALVLEGDERLDETDAEDLKRFLATDAIPGCAYGLRAFQMLPGGRYDPRPEWVYCLFAPQRGQHLSRDVVKSVRVPDSIPRRSWVRTTFRIQRPVSGHVTSATAPRWRARQPGTPALHPPHVPADAGTASAWPVDAPQRPAAQYVRVVCLLPARNCVDDLPGYFESVREFADAVVALDDGSTDGTGLFLERHPLVKILLRNPMRDTYAGWDDGANRNRLLDAAAKLEPDWIVSLDADERIPKDDARALRRFIQKEACLGYAYGFSRYRMVDDLDHFDRIEQRSWRLFAYEPGHRFPDRRLHHFPIPTEIPRERWLPTSVRIQHLAGLTLERREARWTKFQEADPERHWEPDYEYTRAPPGERRRWHPRPPDLPVLPPSRDAERRVELEVADPELAGDPP
jgi:Glycosyl transferase family 2